jgi:hypothetical protein
MSIDLLYSSSLRNWCSNVNSRRCLLPFEIISFPASSDFAKYLMGSSTTNDQDDDHEQASGCKELPSDPRVHIQNPWATAGAATKQDFEDETVMERQAGWDDKIKEAFAKNNNNNNDSNNKKKIVLSFSKQVDQVEAAMKKLEKLKMVAEGVCVTGAFGTIDDAGWALPSNTPSCLSLNDVFTTLITSTKIVSDLKKQQELIKGMFSNEEDGNDGNNNNNHDEDEETHLYFALRPWLEVNPSTEFRVFVQNKKIIGICQRHMDLLFPHLFSFALTSENENEQQLFIQDQKEAFAWALQIEKVLIHNVVEPNSAVSDFIIDIIHPGPDSLHLPLHIVGVEAISSLSDIGATTNSDRRQEDAFRVFGSFQGLEIWKNAVDKFLSNHQGKEENENNSSSSNIVPSTIIRIATSSDDLFKDNRAAQRGGVPLEFVNQELYQQTVEVIQAEQIRIAQERLNNNINSTSYQASGTQIIDDILKTRSAVHGVDNPAI